MNQEEIIALFDQQAANYDKQWQKMSAIHNGMYFFIESLVAKLPANAKIICVGAGTGKEIQFLAKRFPGWTFTVVEPSGAMLNICRDALAKQGMDSRCYFHEGYLNTLHSTDRHDVATCFNVSHFIVDIAKRTAFFAEIADTLKSSGLLIGSDLSFDIHAQNYQSALTLWFSIMSDADISAENIEKMKNAYANDVAILPQHEILSLIERAGFDSATPFYQAGLIQAYFARRK